MANSPRSGREGTALLLAFQDNFKDRKQAAADFIKLNFAPTLLRIDPDGEQQRSATIVQGGADTLNTPGILGGAWTWEGEIIPQILPYLLVGQFNPSSTPTSVLVPNTEIRPSFSLRASGGTDHELVMGVSGVTTTPAAQSGDPKFPAKVQVNFASATAGAGTLVVTGFRKRTRSNEAILRRKVVERLPVASGSTVAKTKGAFIDIESITFDQDIANGSTIEFVPEIYKTIIVLSLTQAQFSGFSGQYYKGGVPGCAFDMIPNIAEFRFQDEMRFSLEGTAGIIFPQALISDPTEEAYAAPASGDFALSNFPDPELAFSPNWGRALSIGDDTDPIPVNGVTVRVNNNYGPPTGATGDRFAGQPIVTGDGFRQTTCEIDTPYISGSQQSDTFKRWHDFYLDNRTEALKMQCYNYLDNGDQRIIQVDMPRFQLTEFPNVDAEGPSGIDRTLTGKCVKGEDSAVPNEIAVTIWDKNQYPQS